MLRRDIPPSRPNEMVASWTKPVAYQGQSDDDKNKPILLFSDEILTVFHIQPRTSPVATNYQDLQNFLLCHYDAMNGIQTHIEMKEVASGKTIPMMTRDARAALPDEQRLHPDHPLFAINNGLLQTLGTVRTLDHLLSHRAQSNPEHARIYEDLRMRVQNTYVMYFTSMHDLQNNIATGQVSEKEAMQLMQRYQMECNDKLINIIHWADLDRGLSHTVKDYAKLLAYYRQMSALLDPAMGMQTIIEDPEHQVVQVDTALPITKKTQNQKNLIADAIVEYTLEPEPGKKNFHNHRPLAYQEINFAFREELVADDRRLPAQMRNFYPVTVKNGYVTRQDTFFPGETQSMPVWGVRSATMPYVGTGENVATVRQQVQENFTQVREALLDYEVGQPNLHFMVLNTNSPAGRENVMVGETVIGATASNVTVSRLPQNIWGTLEGSTVSPNTVAQTSAAAQRFQPLNKARTLEVTVGVAKHARENGEVTMVACASGQDRTGTVKEADAQQIIYDQYQAHGITMEREKIARVRAAAGHNVMLASLAVPGSPGLKKVSTPRNYFSPTVTDRLYLSSASTNRTTPVSAAGVADALSHAPNRQLRDDYIRTAEQILKFAHSKSTLPFIGRDKKKVQALHALAKRFQEESLRELGQRKSAADIVSSWKKQELKNPKKRKGQTYGEIISRKRIALLGSKDKDTGTKTFVDSITRKSGPDVFGK